MKTVFVTGEERPDVYRQICAYVGEKVWGEDRGFSIGTAMGVFDYDGNLAGAIIFHNYDRWAGTIEISGAAETARWLTRPVLWAMFDYPFNRIGCQAVFMRVDPADRRLRRILTAYGFDYFEIPHLRGKGKPEGVYILSEDDWRANGFHAEKG